MRYWGFVLLIGLLAACIGLPANTSSSTIIDLSELQPLPVRLGSDVVPLGVTVAAVVSPQGTLESYQPLLDYLSHQLDRPVELVQW